MTQLGFVRIVSNPAFYGLALRMLWNREDAEDATQESLVYRVAVNYILNVKKSPVERLQLTFEMFAEESCPGPVVGRADICGAVVPWTR